MRRIGTQPVDFARSRDTFLRGLASPTGRGYKRYLGSPIRYAGGKSLAVGLILSLMPSNMEKLVSPFLGGGSVEVACASLGLPVEAYDIFDVLINYWDIQISSPEALYQELAKLKPDKETFERIRLTLRSFWEGNRELEPLKLATYFVYNFNLSYGPGFMGWSSQIYLNEPRYQRMLARIREFDGSNLYVGCSDFRDVIASHPDDFLYCDPPYYIGDGSKMFKGIYPMRNIPVHHNGFPHSELRELLCNHRGGFILSYNDCPTIRDYYEGFSQEFPAWQYTMGQGETRIGKNRLAGNGGSNVKKSHEILIWSPRR